MSLPKSIKITPPSKLNNKEVTNLAKEIVGGQHDNLKEAINAVSKDLPKEEYSRAVSVVLAAYQVAHMSTVAYIQDLVSTTRAISKKKEALPN